jgi:hypothetical protein
VIGVNMRVHRLDEFEIEFFDKLEVPIHAVEDRVDDERLSPTSAGQQVSVRARFGMEELSEDHCGPTSRAIRHDILARHSGTTFCAALTGSDRSRPRHDRRLTAYAR